MEHLDGVGEVKQPHRTLDVLTPNAVGDPLASQRVKTCRSGSHTSAVRPSRPAS
jgi:hypothetical protein